jgi:hypothetical protein
MHCVSAVMEISPGMGGSASNDHVEIARSFSLSD